MKFRGVLILILTLLLLFSGCKKDEKTEQAADAPKNQDTTVFSGSQNVTLFSNDACSYTLLSIGTDENGDYCWNVELKNLTDHDLIFSMDQVYVNEMYADPYWAERLGPGQSVSATVSWLGSTLEECGISDVSMVEFKLTAYDPQAQDTPLADRVLSLYPKGKSAYTGGGRKWKDTDTVLADYENSFAMAVTAVEQDSESGTLEGYALRLYLENRTELDARFSLENVKVNGQSSAVSHYRDLAGGKGMAFSIQWLQSDLQAMEIGQVLSIEFDLVMTDKDGQTIVRETLSFNP